MSLTIHLSSKRDLIVGKWFDSLLETYPPEASAFMRREKDQFANPVGHTMRQEVGNIYDELCRGLDHDKLAPLLDRIIRIRAIQGFSPSGAVRFVFQLREIIRGELEQEDLGDRLEAELRAFEVDIEGLLLLAFDVYMRCREQLFENKVNEVKSRTYRLLQMADLIAEIPEQEQGSPGGQSH